MKPAAPAAPAPAPYDNTHHARVLLMVGLWSALAMVLLIVAHEVLARVMDVSPEGWADDTPTQAWLAVVLPLSAVLLWFLFRWRWRVAQHRRWLPPDFDHSRATRRMVLGTLLPVLLVHLLGRVFDVGAPQVMIVLIWGPGILPPLIWSGLTMHACGTLIAMPQKTPSVGDSGWD